MFTVNKITPRLVLVQFSSKHLMNQIIPRYELLETYCHLKVKPSMSLQELRECVTASGSHFASSFKLIHGYALFGATFSSIFRYAALSPVEKALKAKLAPFLKKGTQIIVTSKSTHDGVFAHEFSHYLFATSPSYKKSVLKYLSTQKNLELYMRGLARLGYADKLWLEEINAFCQTTSPSAMLTDLGLRRSKKNVHQTKKLFKVLQARYQEEAAKYL